MFGALLVGWFLGTAGSTSASTSAAAEPLPADSLDIPWVQALLKRGDTSRAEAAARALAAQFERATPIDSLQWARALDLTVEASLRGGKVQEPELIELGLRVIALREAVLGPDDVLVADALYSLGRVETSQARHAEADAHFRRCLAIRERAIGAESDPVASTMVALARVLMRSGDNLGARDLLLRALPIRERTHGADAPQVAFVHRYLGDACFFTGEFDRAREHYTASISVLERAFGPDHLEVGITTFGFGAYQLTVGDFGGAESSFLKTIRVLEANYGPNTSDLAPVLHNLSQLYWTTGDLGRARQTAERAIAIADSSLGAESSFPGKFRSGLGDVALAEGEYAEARRLYREALTLIEKAAGPDHPDVGEALRLQAALLAGIGDSEEARALAERALAIYERAEGPTGPTVATVLDQLGALARDRGERKQARAYLERALAIRETNDAEKDLHTASILEHLAALELDAGAFPHARELLVRALALQEAAYGDSSSWVAESLLPLGHLELAAGHVDAALQAFERARDVRLLAYGEEHPKVAEALAALAEARLAGGDLTGAFDEGLKSEDIARRHLMLTARTLPERPVLEYAKARPRGLDIALSALATELEGGVRGGAGEGRVVEANATRAFDAVIESRALVFDEIAARQRVTRDKEDEDTARLRSEWQRTRAAYAQLLIRDDSPDDPALAGKARLEARRRMESAEEAFAAHAPLHERSRTARERTRRDAAAAETAVSELASRLEAHTTLVSFVLFDRYGRAGDGRVSEPHYLAFVLTPQAASPRVVSLGSGSVVDGAVDRWREEMLRHDREDTYLAAGATLREEVWDLLWSTAPQGAASSVLVVPDGSLHLVDWNTLPIDSARYLIEAGTEVYCLGAERDLLDLAGSEVNAGPLLALGGAAYDSTGWSPGAATGDRLAGWMPVASKPVRSAYRGPRDECLDLRSARFEDLPGTRTEVQEVSALWSGPTQRLSGARASEGAFKSLAPGQAALHLATHGFFLGGSCLAAGSLRGIGGLGRPVAGAQAPGDATAPLVSPLRLCGLALAGANLRGVAGADEEDGILTAEEIAAIDLHGVELVTLSACETGLGVVQRGEGVIGLRRSFQLAGARTVITSLWPVSDDHALDWSRRFYATLADPEAADRSAVATGRGSRAASAARIAELEMLSKRRADDESTHPFHWAGFVTWMR